MEPLGRTADDFKYIKSRLIEYLYIDTDLDGLDNLIQKSKKLTGFEEARCAWVFEQFYHYKKSQFPPLSEAQQKLKSDIQFRLREIESNRGTDDKKFGKDEERKLKMILKEIDPLYFVTIEPSFK